LTLGDDNPNKKKPKACTTPDCQTKLIAEYKKKTEAMFNALIVAGGSKLRLYVPRSPLYIGIR